MSDTMTETEGPETTETSDAASSASSAAETASAAVSDSSSAASGGLTDAHHDLVQSFCGIDSRSASTTSDQPDQSANSSSDSGGFFSSIASAVSNAASGAISTVENVASDVGHTVADAASGVVNTVETAASGVEHTVVDAGSGILDTAEKVAGDIGSGHLGQALSDTEDGVVTTAGRVVSDSAHAIVDTGSAALDAAGKVVTDTQQTVADAATGVINTAGKVAGDVAHTVSDAAGPDSMIGRAADEVGNFATSAAGAAVDTVNTATDLSKGVVEGVVGGVDGLAKGVVNLADSAGKEAYALATDEKAREDALNTVVNASKAVGDFEVEMVTDPGKALGQAEDAASSAARTVGNVATTVYQSYEKAAAAGHGAEFIGKGVGQAAVLVAGAVLTDGASVAAEGGAVAAEGAAVIGEGAALAGEGAAVVGEGAAVAGEGAAVAGEGAAVAGEGAATAGEAAAAGEGGAAGEAGAAAGEEGAGAGGGAGGGDGGGGGGGEPPDEPMSLSEDAERRRDILEEFEEHQQRHGHQQMEVADEGPDPNFDEPNRIPELQQGPDGVQRDVSLGDVKATQSDISPAMGDGTPIEDVTAQMGEEGWDATKPDPQMVQNEDNSLSTLDHRRLSAAEGAELDEVPATVHAPDEPIPEDQAERFQLRKKFTDPETGTEYPKGASPDNWGEAAKFREANQGGELPRAGRTPDIRPNAPGGSPPEASVSDRAEAEMRRFEQQDPRARDVTKEFDDAEKARQIDLEAGDAEDEASNAENARQAAKKRRLPHPR